MSVQQRRHGRAALLTVLSIHLIFPFLWLFVLAQNGPIENDWWHLRVTAERFLSGNWDALYIQSSDPVHPGYFWRYPPYMLYAVTPLAWLSPAAAYAAMAGLTVVSLAIALPIISRRLSVQDRLLWAAAVVLSAPALTTVIDGQLSGLLLLILTAGWSVWMRGSMMAGCLVLGLLAIKPNIAVFFGLFLLARGNWRGALAMGAVIALLVLTTIPLGLDLWRNFLSVSFSNAQALPSYEGYKLITLRGVVEWTVGAGPRALGLWLAMAVTLTVSAVWRWRVPGPLTRDFSSVVLLAIAVNPYGFFYDALLLAFPASMWWAERATWRQGPWKTVGVLIALAWLAEQLAHSWAPGLHLLGWRVVPPISLVGPVCAIWLVLVLREGRRSHRAVATGRSLLSRRALDV